MEQLYKNKGIMKNEYYTNRHYRNTDKIRIAVSNMNKDIRELSEYCDNLEAKIERLNNIIKQIYEIFKNGRFEDDCDCIQIEEIITREIKGSDKE